MGDSASVMGAITAPILFPSSAHDEMIPSFMMDQLHSLASKSLGKQIVRFQKGGHMDLWLVSKHEYYAAFSSFLKSRQRELGKTPISPLSSIGPVDPKAARIFGMQ